MTSGEFAIQRGNMVDSQLRPSDIADRRIVRAMGTVPREIFTSGAWRSVAYRDGPLRACDGTAARFLLPPVTLAKMLDAVTIDDASRVLDVGCATGYSTAILAHLSNDVRAVECDEGLAQAARANLSALGLASAEVVTSDLPGGCAPQAPYDAIVVEGAIPGEPTLLLRQLRHGGRLVAISSGGGSDHAVLWTRVGEEFSRRTIFDGSAPPAPGFETRRGFIL